MPPTSFRVLFLFVAALVCGCALVSKKVPTPAAKLTGEDLARLPQPPDERFFLVFFGANDARRDPENAHTWASLIRVRAGDVGCVGSVVPGQVDPALDVQTISWLPVSGKVAPWRRTVEPGRNYELHETFRFADGKASVAVWGPYEVWHGFAHRYRVQKEFLDSGAVGYQAVDTYGEAARLGNGCDCIHAISDMDPVYRRLRYALAFYGKPATANIVRRFMHSPIWINPHTEHEWLLPRLGLDAYKLQTRKYIGFAREHVPGAPVDLESRTVRAFAASSEPDAVAGAPALPEGLPLALPPLP